MFNCTGFTTWIQILTLPIPGYVFLSKLFNFSDFLFYARYKYEWYIPHSILCGYYYIHYLCGLNDFIRKGFRLSLVHVCLYAFPLLTWLFFILFLLERINLKLIIIELGFPGGSVVKNLLCNVRNTSLTPGLGRPLMPTKCLSHNYRAHDLKQEEPPQWESPHAAGKTHGSQKIK